MIIEKVIDRYFIETQLKPRTNWFGFSSIVKRMLSAVLCVTVAYPVNAWGGSLPANAAANVNDGHSVSYDALLNKPSATTTVTTTGQSGNGNLNIKEILPGSSTDASSISDYYNNQSQLKTLSQSSINVGLEKNCVATSFTPVSMGQKIASMSGVNETNSLPAGFTGTIPFSTPALGGSQTKYYTYGTNNKLVINMTPYSAPRDGTFVATNFSVSGASSYNISDYGTAGNGFTPKGTITGVNSGPIEVYADIYQVNRTYTEKPASLVCPPDPPVGACNLNGVDICDAKNVGIAKLLSYATSGNKVVSAQADAYKLIASTATKPRPTRSEIDTLLSQTKTIFNGTASEIGEIFGGCQFNETYNSTHVASALENKCNAVKKGVDSCTAHRTFNTAAADSGNPYVVATISFWNVSTGAQTTGSLSNQALSFSLFGTNSSESIPGTPDVVNPGPPPVTTPGIPTVQLQYTPFVLDVTQYIPHSIDVVAVDGAGNSIPATLNLQTVGDPATDGWTLKGTVSAANAKTVYIRSRLNYVVNSELTGCEGQRIVLSMTSQKQGTTFVDLNNQTGNITTGSGTTSGDRCPEVTVSCDTGAYKCINVGSQTICDQPGNPYQGVFSLMEKFGSKWDEKAQGWCNQYIVAGSSTCSAVDTSDTTMWQNNLPLAGYVDNCSKYTSDSQCTLTNISTCTSGMMAGGVCLEYDVSFKCESSSSTTSASIDGKPQTKTSNQDCLAAVRCMGTECKKVQEESSPNFAKAAAMLQVLQNMQQDFTCIDPGSGADLGRPDPAHPFECTPSVFKGERYTCRHHSLAGAGFVPNCCAQADEIATQTMGAGLGWLKAAMTTYKVMTDATAISALQYMGADGAINALNGMNNLSNSAVSMVTEPLANGATNIATEMGYDISSWFSSGSTATELGYTTVEIAGGETGLAITSQFGQEIAKGVYEFVGEDLGNELFVDVLDSAGAATGELALSPMLSNIVMVFNAIMWIYMVYQLLTIIGHLLYKCEDRETQLGTKLGQRSCHYVGDYCSKSTKVLGCIEKSKSYCCYNGPLPRIIQEQIRPQLYASAWGSAENPTCGGVSPTELVAVDWNRVDLSEWIDLLKQSGLLPQTLNDVASKYAPTTPYSSATTNNRLTAFSAKFTNTAGKIDTFRKTTEAMEVCYDLNHPEKMAFYKGQTKPYRTRVKGTSLETTSVVASWGGYGDGGIGYANFDITRPSTIDADYTLSNIQAFTAWDNGGMMGYIGKDDINYANWAYAVQLKCTPPGQEICVQWQSNGEDSPTCVQSVYECPHPADRKPTTGYIKKRESDGDGGWYIGNYFAIYNGTAWYSAYNSGAHSNTPSYSGTIDLATLKDKGNTIWAAGHNLSGWGQGFLQFNLTWTKTEYETSTAYPGECYNPNAAKPN